MNKERKPKVSIVLPVYNGERYIKEALESILHQTMQEWELIIVDDCSTDRTRIIISEYQKIDSRIKVVTNEKNLRLPRSLNVGFSVAEGRYYTWTSDDNILKDNCIEVLSDFLDKNSQISMVYSDFDMIDSKGVVYKSERTEDPEHLPVHNVVCASFMYRAEIAKRIGDYNPDLFLLEDYDYWIRIYLVSKLAHVKQSLYLYRTHEQSLTATKAEAIRKAFKNYREKMNDKLLPTIEDEKVLVEYYASCRLYNVNCERPHEVLLLLKHPTKVLIYVKNFKRKLKWKRKAIEEKKR